MWYKKFKKKSYNVLKLMFKKIKKKKGGEEIAKQGLKFFPRWGKQIKKVMIWVITTWSKFNNENSDSKSHIIFRMTQK
jgi:hypothetical protein